MYFLSNITNKHLQILARGLTNVEISFTLILDGLKDLLLRFECFVTFAAIRAFKSWSFYALSRPSLQIKYIPRQALSNSVLKCERC